MEILKGAQALTHPLTHPVVTIGNFDGVHLGHQKIIELAKKKAQDRGGQCVAYTFRPHPQMALRPQKDLQLLTTYDEKLKLLGSLGLDLIIEEPFSRTFSTIEPRQFFSDILIKKLGAECIVVGYDFGFGKNRDGHLDHLASFCQDAGVELVIVHPQSISGEVASSSRIRAHLLSGEMEAATRLLGRPFSYEGIVVHGEGRGRKIGFPTANLKLENKLALPYGVYSTWTLLDEKRYPSVTNIGVRPTFHSSEDSELAALVETHLLDQSIDLYGHSLEVQFVKRLRAEKKFAQVQDLKNQIALDITEARSSLTIS